MVGLKGHRSLPGSPYFDETNPKWRWIQPMPQAPLHEESQLAGGRLKSFRPTGGVPLWAAERHNQLSCRFIVFSLHLV